MRGKIYPKMISQKAKESENKRQNHPKKSPAIRHRSSPKRKRKRLLEVQNSQKSEIRVKKMEDDHTFEENIILQQLSRGTHPKRKRRRLLEGQELPKKRNEG
jgi:hypothetical protein